MDSNAIPPVRFARAADGTSIAFMVWPGTGPPFLILHSPGGTPINLQTQMPFLHESYLRFAAGRAMVTFDWRGSGQSERKLPTCLNDLVMDLAAVTEVIEGVPDVVAPNASCLLAASFASKNPGAWRSLLLTDPMVRMPLSPQGILTRPGWEDDHVGMLQALARHFFPRATVRESEKLAREWAVAVPLEAHQIYFSVLGSVDITETLQALQIATLIMKILPRSAAAEVAALVPDTVLVELEHDPIGARGRRLWDMYIGSRFSSVSVEPSKTTASLSEREREVLAALARGRSNEEIATALTLSIRTVERHVRNIYNKIGVHNRAAATRWAIENGFG